MAKQGSVAEGLAIQDTLMMDTSDRLKLIAALIVDAMKTKTMDISGQEHHTQEQT